MEQSVRQEVGEIVELSSMYFGLSTTLSCRKQSQWMDDFKTTNLLESRQIQCQHQVGCSVYLHLYQFHGHSKKQTAVSHSSTEAEVRSLDTGLRMEGVFAITLWDIVVGV